MTLQLPEKIGIPQVFKDAFRIPSRPEIQDPISPIDAKVGETVFMEITQKHIDMAYRSMSSNREPSRCGAQVAADEFFGGVSTSVGSRNVTFSINGERRLFTGGEALAAFTSTFDNHRPKDNYFFSGPAPRPTTIPLTRTY